MVHYEYKVVPAPRRGQKARGVRSPEARFANALEVLMNKLGAEGWEYQRTDTLPAEQREGLTSKTTVFQNMLVFRRDALAQVAIPKAPAPLALPEPVAQEDTTVASSAPPPLSEPSPIPAASPMPAASPPPKFADSIRSETPNDHAKDNDHPEDIAEDAPAPVMVKAVTSETDDAVAVKGMFHASTSLKHAIPMTKAQPSDGVVPKLTLVTKAKNSEVEDEASDTPPPVRLFLNPALRMRAQQMRQAKPREAAE